MNVDGTNVVRLTNNPAHDQGPSWSPDGRRIAFGSNREGNFDIFVMNADGSNVQAVTTAKSYERVPNWHPFEDKIAYSCDRGGDRDICVMDLETRVETNLTNDSSDQDAIASWSPDGTKIAYRKGANSLWVMNADGSGKKQLTNNGMGPTWSPDGKLIGFSSNRDNGADHDIYTMNADGSNQKRLVHLPTLDDDIDWGILVGSDSTPPPNTHTPTVTPTPTFTITPSPTVNLDTPTPQPEVSGTLTPTPRATATVRPTNTSTPTSTTVPTVSIGGNICGPSDVDGDGKFEINDFQAFAQAYGMGNNSCADTDVDYGPCGGKDANGDGVLDIVDFGGVGIGFAQRYYPRASCAL